MGQINCQCQFNNIDDKHQITNIKNYQSQTLTSKSIKINTKFTPKYTYFKNQELSTMKKNVFEKKNHHNRQKCQEKLEYQNQGKYLNDEDVYTIVNIKSQFTSFQVKVQTNKVASIGTITDCTFKLNLFPNKNLFKVQIFTKKQQLFLKDCGVGLGCFILKKKVIQRSDFSELFLNIEEYFITIKIKSNSQINYQIFTSKTNQQGTLSFQHDSSKIINEKSIKFAENDILTITPTNNDREFLVRCKNRKNMWVYLNNQTKIKERDVLRFGSQTYEVEGILNYLQSSMIIDNY